MKRALANAVENNAKPVKAGARGSAHLAKIVAAKPSYSKAARQWFAALPRKVQIATESTHDRDLLWDALSEGLPDNLDSSVYDLRPLFDEAAFNEAVHDYHEVSDHPWHHALHDAKAHCAGWAAR